MSENDLKEAAAEGRRHGITGAPFSACPYTYDKTGGIPQAEFDAEWRPRLDAWFRAWDAARRSNALEKDPAAEALRQDKQDHPHVVPQAPVGGDEAFTLDDALHALSEEEAEIRAAMKKRPGQ